MPQLPWDEFKRTQQPEFWGCVLPNGEWVDSSETFRQAMIWCAKANGQFSEKREDVLEAIRAGQYSIVHSTLLKQMYEKGLIK